MLSMSSKDGIGGHGAGRWQTRLDKMLAAGRITAAEAASVRLADDEGAREAALGAIRLSHARERVQVAVDSDQMSENDAAAFLERVANGEEPKALRALLHRRRGRHTPRRAASDPPGDR